MKARLSCILLILCLCGSAFASDAPIAFVDVTVIPMTGPRAMEHQTVIVFHDVISELGPADSVHVPADAVRIPGQGRFLVPGFTDAHVHLLSTTELPLYLANGVTTVLNLNGRPAHLLWRTRIREGKLTGPVIFTAGPAFNSRHTPAEAVRMVDEQAAAGYDAVKIYNQVSREEYAPLIAEAKKKNLLLMGHVAREPGFEATLQAGQSIAHAEEFTYTYFNTKGDEDFSGIVFDESKLPAVARMTAASGIYVIPTICTFRDIVSQATDLDHYLQNPHMKYLAPWVLAGLQPGANIYYNRYSPDDLKQLQRSLPFQRKLIRALQDAGVPLLAGTDSTNIGPIAGFSIHEELSELVASGLSPYEALQAATVNPAKYLRRPESYGTIEKGKRADIILLEGNPLEDIANTRRIAGVVARGKWLDSEELESMIDGIPSAYDRQIRMVEEKLESAPVEAKTYLDQEDPSGAMAAAALVALASKKSAPEFHQLLASLREKLPGSELVSEQMMNELGYSLLNQKRLSLAVQIFQENVDNYPQSANALDSLAEAYAKSEDPANAVRFYRKALQLDPKYGNAEFARKFVDEHAGNPSR